MDANRIVIVIIFLVLSTLCGIICFACGSGVGGTAGYSIARKQGKSDDEV